MRDRLHEEDNTLNSEYRRLFNLYIKEITLKLWMYQKYAAVFNISAQRFSLSRIHGPIRTDLVTLSGSKSLASPPLISMIVCSMIFREEYVYEHVLKMEFFLHNHHLGILYGLLYS